MKRRSKRDSAKRVGLLGALLAVVLCGSARAVTLVTPGGQVAQPYQAWAERALVPTARAVLVVDPDVTSCVAATGFQRAACARPGGVIWLSPGIGRHTLYHELGHVFDYDVLTDSSRRGFERIMLDPRAWRSPPNSPHEQFAEAYAACAMRRSLTALRAFEGFDFSYHPTARQFRRVCSLIHRAGSKAG